jgi:hypothetical protein
MPEPLHIYPEPTVDEILSDEIVQAMMAADRVDRTALKAMLAKVAQEPTTDARNQPSDKLTNIAGTGGWEAHDSGVTRSSLSGSPG